MEDPFIIDITPPNGEVVCDACNREPPDNEQGGCLVGSWFFCKECTKTISNPKEIDEQCPNTMTSKEWIQEVRLRNN